MARCGCSGTSGCSCVVTGGAGIKVSGSGTGPDPYVIDSTATSITGTLTVVDTSTVDLTLGGSGSITDPYKLSADASLEVADLSDVATGAPAAGDTLLWDGTQWVYGPPSSGGGGAVVTTTTPITGDGSVTSPVGLATSGTWGTAPLNVYGTNTLLGAPIYVDTAGQVRSQPNGADVLATGASRPSQYPGRLIVQDGVLYYSTGSAWRPLTPTVEGPYLVGQARWAAAGLVLGSGVTAASTGSNAVFTRYGSIVSMYLNGVGWTPAGGATNGDISNKALVTIPESMKAAYNVTGSSSGIGGRLTALVLQNYRAITATSVLPTVTNTSSSQAWPAITTSWAMAWQLDPALDPEVALASVKAQATTIPTVLSEEE